MLIYRYKFQLTIFHQILFGYKIKLPLPLNRYAELRRRIVQRMESLKVRL